MSIQGDIQTFSLSAIGRMIHDEKKTGILSVSSDDSVTRIYFNQGGIVFISGDLAEELSLGALLKADKLVQETEIQNALEIAANSNKRLGVILIEQGCVTKEDLVKVLNQQFKEAISKALTWKEGTFVYHGRARWIRGRYPIGHGSHPLGCRGREMEGIQDSDSKRSGCFSNKRRGVTSQQSFNRGRL